MRVLLVDGYNVIWATEPYLALVERDDWELARNALISDVASYVSKECRVTVVFDGTANPHSDGTPENHIGVTVIYSPYGKTADAVIERLAAQERERGNAVEVVTSDAQTQWAVMRGAVVRRSSREFAESLRDSYNEYTADAQRTVGRVNLEDRISPEAAELLRRLAEGD